MVICDQSMGLSYSGDMLHVNQTDCRGSHTLLVGELENGLGVHLYQEVVDHVEELACAVYLMDGMLKYHERGPSISMKPFGSLVYAEKSTLSDYVYETIRNNGVSVIARDVVNKPQTTSADLFGPALEDLHLPLPF